MTAELRTRHELYVDGGYSFAPDHELLRRPKTSTAEDWSVRPHVTSERMITHVRWFDLEHHQLAMLRRDGSVLALAAARLPVLVGEDEPVAAGLALGRPADLHVHAAEASVSPGGVVRAEASIPDGDWLASMEIQGDGWRGRARYAAPVPTLVDGFGLSDPILVDEDGSGQGEFSVDLMFPSTNLGGRRRMGLYFELYGAEEEERLDMSVSVERTDRSVFQRIIGVFGLTSGDALQLSWTESTEAPGTASRHLEIDLDGLPEGEYRITVAVARASGDRAASSKVVILG